MNERQAGRSDTTNLESRRPSQFIPSSAETEGKILTVGGWSSYTTCCVGKEEK